MLTRYKNGGTLYVTPTKETGRNGQFSSSTYVLNEILGIDPRIDPEEIRKSTSVSRKNTLCRKNHYTDRCRKNPYTDICDLLLTITIYIINKSYLLTKIGIG